MIQVFKSGLLTSVQDLGRPGYQRYGIVVGGALDGFAARAANIIVGNEENAAVLEMAQLGPGLLCETEMLVAWCGADFDARLDGEVLPRDHAVRVSAGQVVSFGIARSGLRAWLAVAGGIDVPLVLGSRSTYRRAGFGGHEGRPLIAGDRLKIGQPTERGRQVLRSLQSGDKRVTTWAVRPDYMGRPAPAGTVRAMRGPEWDWFTARAQQEFFSGSWKVTNDSDRMGVRLEGIALERRTDRELVSEAVNAGVVQVPPSGQPIVLLASRQSVGGYARIAAVATADLGRFTQLRPGDAVKFQEITLPLAHELYTARERDLNRVRTGLARLAG